MLVRIIYFFGFLNFVFFGWILGLVVAPLIGFYGSIYAVLIASILLGWLTWWGFWKDLDAERGAILPSINIIFRPLFLYCWVVLWGVWFFTSSGQLPAGHFGEMLEPIKRFLLK